MVVGVLALVGVGASSTHYPYEPANEGFLDYPTVVALHVVLGAYLMLAGFQFVGRIRHPGYHRWVEGGGARLDRHGGRGNELVHGPGDPLQQVRS